MDFADEDDMIYDDVSEAVLIGGIWLIALSAAFATIAIYLAWMFINRPRISKRPSETEDCIELAELGVAKEGEEMEKIEAHAAPILGVPLEWTTMQGGLQDDGMESVDKLQL